MSQRINKLLRQNVDYAISRFEASDLSAIVELDILLNNIQMTHKLLSQYLKLESWDLIMRQGNENCSFASYHNRILLHVLYETATDFAPNYNYNNITDRFFRSPVMMVDEIDRDSMPKMNAMMLFGNKALTLAYMPIFDNFRDVISVPHIAAIVHLLGRTHLPMLVTECLNNISLKIKSVLAPYVAELIAGGLPKKIKRPQLRSDTNSVSGFFTIFSTILKDIISYPDLESEVFRHFKEIGNILVLLLKFDQVLKMHDFKSFTLSCAALGITPESIKRKTTEETIVQAPLTNVIRNSTHFLEEYDECICSPQICRILAENARRADKLYRQPEQTISLFSTILRVISDMIEDSRPEWCAFEHKPANGVIDVEAPYEFYRLWCGLQFVLCSPQPLDLRNPVAPGKNDIQYLQMYGDGINWAACTIIYLLGQRKRFECFSFTDLTLAVEDAAKTRTTESYYVQFLKNAVYDRELNRQIFDILETYLDYPCYNADLSLGVPSTLNLSYFTTYMASDSSSSAPAQRAAASASADAPPALVAASKPAAPAIPEDDEEEEEEEEIPPEEEEEEEEEKPQLPPEEDEEEYEEEGEEEGEEEDEEEEEDDAPPGLPSRDYDEEEEEYEDEDDEPPPVPVGRDDDEDEEEYIEDDEDDDAPPPLPSR